MKVIKKDETVESFDISKIIDAAEKAASRLDTKLSQEDKDALEDAIYTYLSDSTYKYFDDIKTKELHTIVIQCLKSIGRGDVAKSYQEYRDYKNTYAKNWETLKETTDTILYRGDKENANFDSSLISTKGSLIKGELAKELYKQFYLSKTEKELIKRGDIYIHDLRDMLYGSINCCLFDFATVLKDGFDMCNVHYTEPKTVTSAINVIGDITLVASSQQFGGWTIPEIDKILLPYVKKSVNKYKEEAKQYDIPLDLQNDYAVKHTIKDLEQGFQGLELKLNTVVSARGDFPFTTLSFGQFDINLDPTDKFWMYQIGSAIFRTRMKGHGGKQVVFPKLIYLYDENQVNKDSYSKKLFEEAISCSAKCMYPDWLSLSDGKSLVSKEFLKHGYIISAMGCRAYLSPWKDPETNKYIAVGRCNIGAVSLNLPLIMAVAKKEFGNEWKENFWNLLKNRLEVVRNFLRKRYDLIKHTKASTNPMAFTQGGFYKGFLKPEDEIGDLINYMTASFGITALNEATVLWSGKTIYQDNSFAKQVMEFITDNVERFKREDGYLYALYGTPAENLMGVQAKQYKEFTGDDQFGDYFSNSFHCHVSEDITPFQKQDAELELFHMINGGHIQYVRLDNPDNLEAVKAIILRGMHMGFYQGVNFDAGYCEDCHTHFTNCMNKCPNCGSTNITIISRVCGYLGYSRVKGDTRFNDALLKNVYDRKSM